MRAQSVSLNPVNNFRKLFARAIEASPDDVESVRAMALATASRSGRCHVRYVLLKGIEPDGFTFFTHYRSPKGIDLSRNPIVAVAFYWPAIGTQVRIEGVVKKISPQQSDEYFFSRPRGSQIATVASRQSHPLRSRSELLDYFAELRKRYRNRNIPRPAGWGGYCIVPKRIEFWHSRKFRLHERMLFSRNARGEWKVQMLSP